MFGLFKSKKLELYAPVEGKIIDITEVNDQVFANKLTGDGFAVEPEADIITAPCNGTITYIASTKHAIGIESEEGVELLLHAGIDTVELGGEGFELLVEVGSEVQKGDAIMHMDRAVVAHHGKPLTTMLVVTNMADKVKKMDKALSSSGSIVTLTLK